MKKVKVFILGLGLLVLCFSFSSSRAMAANSDTSISITPSILEKLVKPGEVMSSVVKVTNNSNQPITLYAYLSDFKAAAEDESGRAQLIVPGTEAGNYISSWVNISTEGVDLAPGEQKSVPYTVNIPDNVGPGGYYGAIVFGTQAPTFKPGEADTGAAIGISQQTASLLLLQVPGIADERADVREFKSDKNLYSSPFVVNFTTKINNLGNVHIKPMGVIEIRNMMGTKVATLQVNDKGGNILPKSGRLFSNTWKDSFGFGKYEASLALSYGTAADNGGEGRKTLTMFWYFWIIPVKIMISVILSLIALVVIFIIFLRMYRKTAVKRAMAEMGLKGGQTLKVSKASGAKHEHVLTFLILAGIAVVVMVILYFLLF